MIKANPATGRVLLDENASVKRLAWAFGCAKKGSDEERELYKRLVAKVEAILTADKEGRGGLP